MVDITVPDFALIVMIGASGVGKSTLARRLFAETEIVSSDRLRALVSDDEANQAASGDAFDLLERIVDARLKRRLLTVVDATSARAQDRATLLKLARRRHAPTAAILLNLDPALALARNAARARRAPDAVIREQAAEIRRRSLSLGSEGFDAVHALDTPEAVDALALRRAPLACDRRADAGPFDIIGDVHGCFDELCALLTRLGWRITLGSGDAAPHRAAHPAGRRALFLGDLTDRGPKNAETVRLAMGMIASGDALLVLGNHDEKLRRALSGAKIEPRHGLAETLAEIRARTSAFGADIEAMLARTPDHLWLAGGALVAAHAGLPERMHGRAGGKVRRFALYGDIDGSTDLHGFPIRRDWAADYEGAAHVVYGHTPVREVVWRNGALCLDAGCCFGGALACLRWPEGDIVLEPAQRVYAWRPGMTR